MIQKKRQEAIEAERLFFVGLLSLLVTIVLIGFSLYILPRLIWGLNYNVPLFVTSLPVTLQKALGVSDAASIWLTFLIFFVPGVVAGLIAKVTNQRIEKIKEEENIDKPIELAEPSLPSSKSSKESVSLLGQLLLIAISIFLFFRILEWLIGS